MFTPIYLVRLIRQGSDNSLWQEPGLSQSHYEVKGHPEEGYYTFLPLQGQIG